MQLSGSRGFVNIHEVSVPDQMKNKIQTQIKWFDRCFGKGFTPGTCGIFSGDPGAGKSTLMLTVADALAEQEIMVAYNSTEEDMRQVKMTVDRLDLSNPFLIGNNQTAEDVIEFAKKNDVKVLIVDSLQTIGAAGYDAGTPNAMKKAMELFLNYCKKEFVVGIIVNQVTKSGKLAGANNLKHAVDYHLHMDLQSNPRDKSLELGTRILMLEKNRFGVAGVPTYLYLFENGFAETGGPDTPDRN